MPRDIQCAADREPPAFTVVEALVAIGVVGIAGAALAASLTAGGALRGRAAAQTAASGIAHGHIAVLAARPCAAADTGGRLAEAGATGSWTARRVGAAWSWSDSLRAGTEPPIRLYGSVPCAP